jgi:RNA polymerase sigma-70 factor (TIGR02943 family)
MDQEQPTDPSRWVDDHGEPLYRYALLRLRDADEAAEVVQETFLEALKGRARFAGRSTERTWLVGILKHKIIDLYRRRTRRERGVGGDSPGGPDPSEFFDERGSWRSPVSGTFDLPDHEVERAEFWEVFRACLAELPPNHAEAFVLVELEGLAGPEVCQILAITPTNLWARLHRARLQLRKSRDVRWFGRQAGTG